MKEQTLRKIQADVAASDLGTARDRLHGLMATYPDDLDLRRKLGDVYWQLQHPAMAGRYWYLEADQTPEMVSARQAFERSCGDDPLEMLLALKFRGDIEPIRDHFAGRSLLALQERAKKRGWFIVFGKTGRERYQYHEVPVSGGWSCLLALAIAALVALGLLGLMVIGLVTVLQWLF